MRPPLQPSLLLLVLGFSCATGVEPFAPANGGGIKIIRATYGENCSAARGNATVPLAEACNDQTRCEYRVDSTILGDPAVGCSKEFAVDWICRTMPLTTTVFYRQVLRGEAGFGSRLQLACDEDDGRIGRVEKTPTDLGPIQVTSATYGQNCGAPDGNATTAVTKACDGQDRCDYHVDTTVLGDPRKGCAKNFVVEWRCQRSERRFRQAVPGETGFGSRVTLLCGAERRVIE